jgi:nucleoside-diphosphate-sugar epimerase
MVRWNARLMSRILITGKNSFIGTNFKRFTAYSDIDEICLMENKPADIDFRGYDVVLHLAAIVHQSRKIDEPEYFRINWDLALEVADRAKINGVKHYIYLSTLKVFGNGNPSNNLRNEYSACFPDDSYGRSKYAAEKGLMSLADDKFAVSIIRPPLVYGVGVKANMLSLMKLLYYWPVLPFAGIDNRRKYIYTENLAGYIDRIIELRTTGVFITADSNAISTTELVRFISENMRKRTILFRLPKNLRIFGVKFFPSVFDRLYGSLEFDNSVTNEILNFTPGISTREGIKRMVEAFISNPQRIWIYISW